VRYSGLSVDTKSRFSTHRGWPEVTAYEPAPTSPQRGTADLDLAIAVASWNAVDQITAGLVRARRSHHTFVVQGVEIDIVPFGGIESTDRTIRWPNDHVMNSLVMNVVGFTEALATAVRVRLPGDVSIAVASLPAQSVLKLLAWQDRRWLSRRDAIDLRTILHSYHQGPYLEVLYADFGPLLEKHGFDPVHAGAERLGREAGATFVSAAIAELLSNEQLCDALAADMGCQVAENRALIAAYREGFTRPPLPPPHDLLRRWRSGLGIRDPRTKDARHTRHYAHGPLLMIAIMGGMARGTGSRHGHEWMFCFKRNRLVGS
jgi:predicted nucleotidyltransferase